MCKLHFLQFNDFADISVSNTKEDGNETDLIDDTKLDMASASELDIANANHSKTEAGIENI